MYYSLLVLAVGVERLVELRVARRNGAWAKQQGAREYGSGHYPVMVVLHSVLLAGCLLEVNVLHRPFIAALGWSMFVVVLAAQALRWWCITTLGPQWNTRILIVPGLPLVSSGPYRWFRHPNYVAVVAEGVALPLVGSAWITATIFTVANAVLLATRIRAEDAALADA